MSNLFEYQLLKSLVSNREVYEKYGESISFKDTNLTNIHNQIALYYIHNKVNNIDKNILSDILVQLYKDTIYTTILDNIYSIEINEAYISSLQEALLNRQIIYATNEITSNKIDTQNFSDIEEILEVLNKKEIEEELEVSSLSLEEILSTNQGFSWPWESLNNHLGPLPSSSTGMIFGRVEVGKTAVVTNCSLHFLSQGAKVLHLNNEDPIGKLMERYYMIKFGLSKEKILANLTRASNKFKEDHEGSLFIYDTAGLSLKKIQRLISKHDADVVFIDQLDGMSAENDPSSLEKMYSNIRHIAKQEETRVISVTQASHGENNWLTIGDVHNSKVGKQAALDYMIGVGGTAIVPLKRYFTLPKNKLTGKHESFTLTFEPETMRIK